jgi:cyclic beta-1,2-glucan synthetase
MIIKNKKGQPGLWAYGISGDVPIILVTIKNADDIEIAKKMIMAHEYFNAKGLKTDLVILNQEEENYFSYLQNLLIDTILSSNTSYILDVPCGIFVRKASAMTYDDIILLHTAAKGCNKL